MNAKFLAIKQQALDELNLEYFSKPENWDELVQLRIYKLTVEKTKIDISNSIYNAWYKSGQDIRGGDYTDFMVTWGNLLREEQQNEI